MPKPGARSANARLEDLLGYGRFQKFHVWVFTTLYSLAGAIVMYQMVFLVTRNGHRCALPDNLERGFEYDSFKTFSSIASDCSMASVSNRSDCKNVEVASIAELRRTNCLQVDVQKPCEYGYVYNQPENEAFVAWTHEKDWVCEKEEYGSNLLFAQSIGLMIQTVVLMQLSDQYGRRPIFQLSNALFIISRLAMFAFNDNYTLLMTLSAAGAGFFPMGVRVGYTLVAEYTNDEGRLRMYIAGWVAWAVGVAILPLLAWLTEHWLNYGIISLIPSILLVPFYWLTPESPRLLLTKNKVSEAAEIIKQIRKINREPVQENFHEEIANIAQEISQEKSAGVASLTKSKRMALITFIFCFTWTANDFFYVGGQLNVENLAGNKFLNFALVGLSELPSVFIGEFLMTRYGRRWSHCLCTAVTTMLFMAIVPMTQDPSLGWLITTLAIMAKTTGNVGWFINYVQSTELFPTVARVSGIQCCATIATITVSLAPYVILLGSKNLSLMYAIFAGIGLVGTLATTFVPETFRMDFPETVGDIDKRKLHPYFSWRVWEEKEEEEEKDELEELGKEAVA